MTDATRPDVDFEPPPGYTWLLERGIAGYESFGPLQPWHYLPARDVFEVSELWPDGPLPGRLVVFARRQDCDDLACFELSARRVTGLWNIHGWTGSGYDALAAFDSFWDWLKAVTDDIAEWVERSGGRQ